MPDRIKKTLRGRFFLRARRLLRDDVREKLYDRICCHSDAECAEFLQEIVAYAATHVPYYRQVFARRDGRSLEYLPVLTKDLIRTHFDQLKSDDAATRSWYLNSSGGSTGQPVTLMQDRHFKDWSVASERYFYRHCLGFDDIHTPKIILWGSERDIFAASISLQAKLKNWFKHTTWLNAFRIGEAEIRRYVETINAIKPPLIKAYAGSIYELAKFVRQHNLQVYKPQAIYSSAETLRAFMRDEIESVFECKVFDYYGSREVGPIAGECGRGKMHIFNFHNHIEVVDVRNDAVQVAEEGRLLVSTLHNYIMPLLRYEIGDMAILGSPCDCSIESPTLERITGRITDHFRTKDGQLVHGEYFTHLFYFINWVEQFQILQHDYDDVEITYVATGQEEEAAISDIEEKIRLVMGKDCNIRWTQVTEVPSTPQGKRLFTRSLVTADEVG